MTRKVSMYLFSNNVTLRKKNIIDIEQKVLKFFRKVTGDLKQLQIWIWTVNRWNVN